MTINGTNKNLLAWGILCCCAFSLQAENIVSSDQSAAGVHWPFNDEVANESTRYQQVYSSDIFSGPVTIEEIAFKTASASFYFADVRLSLASTDVKVGQLSMDMENNFSAPSTVAFEDAFYVGGGEPGYSLSFQLDQPFDYDPSNGNLLLDLELNHQVGKQFTLLDITGTSASRAIFSNSMQRSDSASILTQFSLQQVPEPSTVTLSILGGIALLFCRWKRNRQSL